jgi:hypothetical protein
MEKRVQGSVDPAIQTRHREASKELDANAHGSQSWVLQRESSLEYHLQMTIPALMVRHLILPYDGSFYCSCWFLVGVEGKFIAKMVSVGLVVADEVVGG